MTGGRRHSGRAVLPEPAASRTVVLVAFDGCQVLDVTGPWEVFAQAANARGKWTEGDPPTT